MHCTELHSTVQHYNAVPSLTLLYFIAYITQDLPVGRGQYSVHPIGTLPLDCTALDCTAHFPWNCQFSTLYYSSYCSCCSMSHYSLKGRVPRKEKNANYPLLVDDGGGGVLEGGWATWWIKKALMWILLIFKKWISHRGADKMDEVFSVKYRPFYAF